MKNKIVIYESQNFLGGGQQLSLEVANSLKQEFEVIFVVPLGSGVLINKIRSQKYKYFQVPALVTTRGKKNFIDIVKFIIFFPFVTLRSYIVLRKINPLIIYANAAPIFIQSSLFGVLLKSSVIWHVHNYFQDPKTVFILRLFSRLSSVKKIAFDSDALMKQFDGIATDCTVVYPSIDPNKYISYKPDHEFRNSLNIEKGQKIITQISYVGIQKSQHIFLRAIKEIIQKRTDVIFLFAGGLSENEADYIQNLNNYVKDNNMQTYVSFLDYIDDIRPLLSASYLNVVVSHEGFSLTIVEAAALGLPTVAANIGGPTIIINNRNNGFFFEYNNPHSLAKSILELLNDTELYNTIKGNVDTISGKYTLQNYYKSVRKLVLDIMQ